MQYSIVFLGASAFAAFAHAQTNPLFFSTMPKQDEKLLTGEPIKVDFKAPKPDPVKITLLRGAPLNNHADRVLSEAATGTSFTFTPDSSYPVACDYGLQIDQAGSEPNYSTHFCIASPDTPSGKEDVSTSTSISGGVTKTTHITTVITKTVTSTTTTPTDGTSVDTTCTTTATPTPEVPGISSTVTTYSAPIYDNSSIIATSVGVVGPSGAPGVPTSIVVATPVVTPTPTPAPQPTEYTPGSGAASLAASGLVAGIVAVFAAVALL